MVVTIEEHACNDVLKEGFKAVNISFANISLRNMNIAITYNYVKTKTYLESLKNMFATMYF